MTKKIFKRLTNFATALMMATILLVPAYADEDANTVSIPKSLVVKNEETGTYYGPNVTFSYSLEPAGSGDYPTISGEQNSNNSQLIIAGVQGGATLKSNTLMFGDDTVDLDQKNDGTLYQNEITKYINVVVDINKFSDAGVYRYLLTDTTTTEVLSSAGITRTEDYKPKRYLDIYIFNNNTSTGSALEFQGYVLSDVEASVEGSDGEIKTVPGDKREGYVGSIKEGANLDTDIYVTYNIELKNQITGSAGQVEKNFSFTANVDNCGTPYSYELKNENFQGTSGSGFTVQMKNDESLYIKGLSPKAKVAYTETNPTNDTYQVTIKGATSSSATLTTLKSKTNCSPNKSVSLESGAVSNYSNVNQEGTLTSYGYVVFENRLDLISPTKFILRYAPFIIIFIFGISIMALVLFRKRKGVKEDTNSI